MLLTASLETLTVLPTPGDALIFVYFGAAVSIGNSHDYYVIRVFGGGFGKAVCPNNRETRGPAGRQLK